MADPRPLWMHRPSIFIAPSPGRYNCLKLQRAAKLLVAAHAMDIQHSALFFS
jgi:hypothetical protein